MSDRRVRGCVFCDVSDDGPRHVVDKTDRHPECCARQGCEDCAASLANEVTV